MQKQVPSSTKVSLDPNTHNLKRNGTIGIMNPYDKNAIEVVLSLRKYHGGQVIILSMGPEENKKSILLTVIEMRPFLISLIMPMLGM